MVAWIWIFLVVIYWLKAGDICHQNRESILISSEDNPVMTIKCCNKFMRGEISRAQVMWLSDMMEGKAMQMTKDHPATSRSQCWSSGL